MDIHRGAIRPGDGDARLEGGVLLAEAVEQDRDQLFGCRGLCDAIGIGEQVALQGCAIRQATEQRILVFELGAVAIVLVESPWLTVTSTISALLPVGVRNSRSSA